MTVGCDDGYGWGPTQPSGREAGSFPQSHGQDLGVCVDAKLPCAPGAVAGPGIAATTMPFIFPPQVVYRAAGAS